MTQHNVETHVESNINYLGANTSNCSVNSYNIVITHLYILLLSLAIIASYVNDEYTVYINISKQKWQAGEYLDGRIGDNLEEVMM